jgi:beta-lactamase class A
MRKFIGESRAMSRRRVAWASILGLLLFALVPSTPSVAGGVATSYQPSWVQNYFATHLWSGPSATSVDYGPVPQWSYFLVSAPQTSSRLFVYVPWTKNYAYVDAKAVGPSGPPPPSPTIVQTIVQAALAGQRGTFGVAVRNLQTGETTILADHDFFPSGSLYKLAVMDEVFRRQQAGGLSLGDVLTIQPSDMDETSDGEVLSVGQRVTVEQALEAMIEVSSNVAAHALADRVGWEPINQTMESLGLHETRLPVGAWRKTVTDWRGQEASTSPVDMLRFFQALYNRQLVSPTASDHMLSLLLNQRINDRLPANLPPGIRVAHKTGNLPNVINDAGIVYGPKANFVLVILTHDIDEAQAIAIEARLSRSLFDHFNGAGAAS